MNVTPPRINAARLEQIRRLGGDTLVLKLIGIMFETGPHRWDAICESFRQGRWEETARIAHSLQSSVGNLGGRWLGEQLAGLESRLRGGAGEAEDLRANTALDDMDSEFQALLHFLEQERKRLTHEDDRDGGGQPG